MPGTGASHVSETKLDATTHKRISNAGTAEEIRMAPEALSKITGNRMPGLVTGITSFGDGLPNGLVESELESSKTNVPTCAGSMEKT